MEWSDRKISPVGHPTEPPDPSARRGLEQDEAGHICLRDKGKWPPRCWRCGRFMRQVIGHMNSERDLHAFAKRYILRRLREDPRHSVVEELSAYIADWMHSRQEIKRVFGNG